MTKSLSVLTLALALAISAPMAASAQQSDAFAQGVAAYEAGDYTVAADFWGPLADNGVPEAQRNLAQLYRLGLGVERDNERAYDLYIAAAEQNSVEAQVNVAFLLLTGEGVDKDPRQAALWFARAADQGDALAQFNLGLMYEKGVGVPQNRETARELYQLAANQGQERALARLDTIEADLPPDGGVAARRERDEARREAAAAEREDREEVERAEAEAEAEEKSAIEIAEAEAKSGPILIIEKIENDPAPSPAPDPAPEVETPDEAPMSTPVARLKPTLFAETAPRPARAFTPAPTRARSPERQQMDSAEAAYGRGDFTAAARLLMPLAQQGDAGAQFMLGRMFNRGEGVAVDHFRAYSLWRSASDQGDARAATALANFSARYRPSDLARAEEYYQEQKSQGRLNLR